MTFWTICPKIDRGDDMTNYKKLYIELLQATDKAIRLLNDAQNRCEELYADLPAETDEEEKNKQAGPRHL